MRLFLLPLLFAILALTLAAPALATDGVLEINHTCALQTGCFSGDALDYPVTISAPGSYRLTSDLIAGDNQRGILINASGVTLDMNGFRLVSASSSTTSVNGITASARENVEIRNGTIQGFRGRGILFLAASRGVRIIDMRTVANGLQGVDLDGTGHLISRSTSVSNLLWGFSVDGDSMVIDSTAENNTAFGLVLGTNTGYRGNMVSGNNGGNLNAQIAGGVDLGLNLCGGDAICP